MTTTTTAPLEVLDPLPELSAEAVALVARVDALRARHRAAGLDEVDVARFATFVGAYPVDEGRALARSRADEDRTPYGLTRFGEWALVWKLGRRGV
jgi:hypothetical protein